MPSATDAVANGSSFLRTWSARAAFTLALTFVHGCFSSYGFEPADDPCGERPSCDVGVEVSSCEGRDACEPFRWCGGTVFCDASECLAACPDGFIEVENCDRLEGCFATRECGESLFCANPCGDGIFLPEGIRGCDSAGDCYFVESDEGEQFWCRSDPESMSPRCGAIPTCPLLSGPIVEEIGLFEPCPDIGVCIYVSECGATTQCLII
ncbi:MAG: hypothetical protein AAF411_05730 [Myxococcota bacterium]